MGNQGYQTIKIRTASYERLQKLLARLSQEGWGSVGAKRDAPPTLADVVDESLQALEARGAKPKR
jgi:hypothetical protein